MTTMVWYGSTQDSAWLGMAIHMVEMQTSISDYLDFIELFKSHDDQQKYSLQYFHI